VGLIEDLKDPLAFPEDTKSVSFVQTHISMVFMCDRYVYKIKKPVNFGFLDFTTIEKRKYFCEKEVELNRRLAEDVYIGVVPVVFDGKRHWIGKKEGKIVDYAVKMKRIPEERIMKNIFKRGDLKKEHLRKIAYTLARFHLNAKTSPEILRYGDPDVFRINTDENFEQVEKYVGISIEKDKFEKLRKWTDSFYKKREIFEKRIEQERIRDCHGDLHMEHVCISDKISVIDCIEFNDRFRYGDTICDIAFLLMDLEYHGGKVYSEKLWDYYREFAKEEDKEVEEILRFYKVYRAFVRGKVNSFQMDDEKISAQEKEEARKRAKAYFDLAYSYIS